MLTMMVRQCSECQGGEFSNKRLQLVTMTLSACARPNELFFISFHCQNSLHHAHVGAWSIIHRQKDFRVSGVVCCGIQSCHVFFCASTAVWERKYEPLTQGNGLNPDPSCRAVDLDLEAVTWKLQMYLSCFIPDLTPACDPELVTSFFSFLDW